jgi:Fe-S-cluster containining protein
MSPRAQEPDLTDVLSTRCGLCCDGSLFADVEVDRVEATRLEVMGLEVEDDDHGALLLQPCGALQGRRCGIYVHRPRCCRTFECRLLKDARHGAVEVDQAIDLIAEARKRIGHVRTLLAGLGHRSDARLPLGELCAEALTGTAGANGEGKRKRSELSAAWSAVETLLQQSFLRSR